MPIPPYPTDELESRISDGSIDQSRLAASVLELQTTVSSMVMWINQQIQAKTTPQPAAPVSPMPTSTPATPEPESAGSSRDKGAGGGNAKG